MRLRGVCSVVAVLVLLGVGLKAQMRGAQELAAALKVGTYPERIEIAREIAKRFQAPRPAELDAALGAELMSVSAENRERLGRLLGGQEVPPPVGVAEYQSVLVDLVTTSENPVVIPALVSALDTGGLVRRAVVRFGEAALEPVAKVAEEGWDTAQVFGALNALAELSNEQRRDLSPPGRSRIEKVAAQRLVGQQHRIVAAAACRLAVATGSGSLREKVIMLANNPEEVRRLGIQSDEDIAYVRSRASRALAGGTLN
jgi:hypothetical protein